MSEYRMAIDTGYTNICLCCYARWGNDPLLVGKHRDLNMTIKCPKCLGKSFTGGLDGQANALPTVGD
jgi:hypothetical protein